MGRENLIFPAQAFNWTSRNGANSLLTKRNVLAEREGFEPPLPFRVNLISSQAPSTGLGHLSAFSRVALLGPEMGEKICKQGCGFLGEHASGNRQLMVETVIFT